MIFYYDPNTGKVYTSSFSEGFLQVMMAEQPQLYETIIYFFAELTTMDYYEKNKRAYEDEERMAGAVLRRNRYDTVTGEWLGPAPEPETVLDHNCSCHTAWPQQTEPCVVCKGIGCIFFNKKE